MVLHTLYLASASEVLVIIAGGGYILSSVERKQNQSPTSLITVFI